MTISYSSANSRIEISGAETWETFKTWLDANPTHAVATSTTRIEPNKFVYFNDGSSLTIASKTLSVSIEVQTADNYWPLRASGNSTRGRLILRAGARIELYGLKHCFVPNAPEADFEESAIVFNREASTQSSGFWGTSRYNTIKNCLFVISTTGTTVGNLDQSIEEITGFPLLLQNTTIRAASGGLQLRSGNTDGLKLEGGCGLSGSPFFGVATYHRNTVLLGAVRADIGPRRGGAGFVLYNLTDGTSRLWNLRFTQGTNVPAGATAGTSAVAAICWVFKPAAVDSSGAGIESVRWYVEGESAPFNEVRTGLTGATGRVVPANGGALAWGGNAGVSYEKTFSEPDAALIVKSRTPVDTLTATVDNLVIPSFRYALRKYGLRPQETAGHTGDVDVTGPVLMPADTGCVLSEAAAAAVTGVSVDWSNLELDVTGDLTLDQVYCYLAYQYAQLAQMPYVVDFGAEGARVNLSGWAVTVSGTLSGGALTELEADSISLTGTLVDIVTVTPGGTLGYVTISAPALVAGSRVQLYDVTNAAEIYNGVLAADGLAYSTTWSTDRTIRLRAEHTDKLPLQTLGILTSSGLSVLDVQADDTVYTANAIDGSTCTEFAADGANVQVDISDPDGVTSVQRLYAWAQWYQTTATGIASDFFGAITALDAATYLIDQALADIHLDNVQATPVRVVGGYLARRDGSTVIATTSGSIQMDPGKAYVASSDGMARESTVQAVLALSMS